MMPSQSRGRRAFTIEDLGYAGDILGFRATVPARCCREESLIFVVGGRLVARCPVCYGVRVFDGASRVWLSEPESNGGTLCGKVSKVSNVSNPTKSPSSKSGMSQNVPNVRPTTQKGGNETS